MKKRLFVIAVAVFALAQLIQPDRSAPAVDPQNDMLTALNAPPEIRTLAVGACYDCHSYASTYPWYAYVTPVNFIVQDHINEGREHLNFSLWNTFSSSEEAGESAEEVQEGEMPPGYYTLMHSHGDLDQDQRARLAAWFRANIPGSKNGGEGGKKEEEEGEHED